MTTHMYVHVSLCMAYTCLHVYVFPMTSEEGRQGRGGGAEGCSYTSLP